VEPAFFVDENDLKLGRMLAEEHDNVMYPGHPDLPEVPRRTADDEWLPIIGLKRLVVITRDQRIRYRPVEKAAWVDHAVRGFVLTGRGSQSTAVSKALLDRHWQAITMIAAEEVEGPWMRSVTQSGLAVIPL
jgi:PIN like domain